jgi:serine/threonine-protein kinase
VPPPVSIDAELDRVLASGAFLRSRRISRFLRFIVEAAREGRSDELKESVIGVAVFDREASYDPRQDPIVRVEARRLRARLTEYYDGPGGSRPWMIELPKGGYAPKFVPREAPLLESAARALTVSPFRSLGVDADAAQFSGGLTQEVIHALTRLDGMRVYAAEFSPEPVRGAARSILEGSIRKRGPFIRVSAHLIDSRDGAYVWTGAYRRESADVFVAQEELAREIAEAVRRQCMIESCGA